MQPRNAILRFFAHLVLFYTLFIIPWPGVAEVYLAGLCAVGNRVLGTMGRDGAVTFQSDPATKWMCVQTLYKRGVNLAARRHHDSRPDYLTTALTASLVLATPTPWRRRGPALLLGLLLINLFVLGRIGLGLLDTFSDDQLALIRFPPFWKDSLRLAVQVFIGSIEASFIVPVFVWIVVTFRRTDLQQWGFAARQENKRPPFTPARPTKTRRASP